MKKLILLFIPLLFISCDNLTNNDDNAKEIAQLKEEIDNLKTELAKQNEPSEAKAVTISDIENLSDKLKEIDKLKEAIELLEVGDTEDEPDEEIESIKKEIKKIKDDIELLKVVDTEDEPDEEIESINNEIGKIKEDIATLETELLELKEKLNSEEPNEEQTNEEQTNEEQTNEEQTNEEQTNEEQTNEEELDYQTKINFILVLCETEFNLPDVIINHQNLLDDEITESFPYYYERLTQEKTGIIGIFKRNSEYFIIHYTGMYFKFQLPSNYENYSVSDIEDLFNYAFFVCAGSLKNGFSINGNAILVSELFTEKELAYLEKYDRILTEINPIFGYPLIDTLHDELILYDKIVKLQLMSYNYNDIINNTYERHSTIHYLLASDNYFYYDTDFDSIYNPLVENGFITESTEP